MQNILHLVQINKSIPVTPSKDREDGPRGKKRRETRQRIADTGLRLFLANGYEATTLDAVAAAAGISRRSFFSYFKSKEDIVMAGLAGAWETVWADLLTQSPDASPLAAVRETMLRHIARYESEQMLALHRLMRSSATLLARKQASYAAQEEALHAVLCQVWRQPRRRPALRLVAMVAVGAMRLAIDGWCEAPDGPPAVRLLADALDALKAEL